MAFSAWPGRELEYIEGLEWEGEENDPMPIVGIEIEVGTKRRDVRERLGSQGDQLQTCILSHLRQHFINRYWAC